MPLSRRQFTRDTLGTLLTFSLLETVFQHDLLAGEVRPAAARWLNDVNQLGAELKGQKLEQIQWQAKVEELFRQVPLADVLALLDFDRLSAGVKFVDNGALSLRFKFPEVEGLPTNLVFGKQIFALKKDRSVVPHGHNNMATAFLILKGDLRGRHYDRLKDEPEHYIIRPTIDRKFAPGECSTISDYKDNVHWFKAITEPAFIFNLHVMGINPENSEPTGRLYLDPVGEKLAGGMVRAKKLSYEACHKLYG
ncbi:MAG: hypothetical protein HYX69_10950 [Planctomycetia bacterium]|nr:hypothetical protein [Planctomycetia bacterium]